jgi:hypothetical protein
MAAEQTFGAAFKAARAKAVKEGRDPSKATFTWKGKSFHTRTGEDESRAKAAASPLGKFYLDKYSGVKGNASKISGAGPMSTGKFDAPAADKPAKRTLKERFETGTLFKAAKGGSIDGCAVRGKTRAPMKKGK